MAIVTLNKVEAATRQLTTAISMWFLGEDSVSVHTLACAAHQVIHDVNSSRGGPELLYDAICFKDEFRGEIIRNFRREYDFFRHADRRPDEQIDFDEHLTETFLLVGSYGLEILGVKVDVVRGAFSMYFSIHHAEFLTDAGRERFIDRFPIQTIEQARAIPRDQFFKTFKMLHTR